MSALIIFSLIVIRSKNYIFYCLADSAIYLFFLLFVSILFSRNLIYPLIDKGFGLQTYCLSFANLSANIIVDKVSPLLWSCCFAQKINWAKARPLKASFYTRVMKDCFQPRWLGTSFPSMIDFFISISLV